MRRSILRLACCSLLGSPLLADNFLILVADDVGVDRIGVYAAHPDPGRTPTVDALARRGVLFRNAFSQPYCSPTRASLLTGRHPYRTGIGKQIANNLSPAEVGLRLEETTLPEMLGAPYTCGVVGKWHLAGLSQGGDHPRDSGFDFHAGSLFNLSDQAGDYHHWMKHVNGAGSFTSVYASTDTVDDALRAIASMPEPWLLLVAFNAAHLPLHAPPAHLHTFALSGVPDEQPVIHYQAAVEAMDTEIGRLLAAVDERSTHVFFWGDNGTIRPATTPPNDPERAKGTPYEGGIHVPLIVAGPAVVAPGREVAALVSCVDLFATVAELAGRPSAAEDSVSLAPYLLDPAAAPRRGTIYAETFRPNGFGPHNRHSRTLRGTRYKLIRWEHLGVEEMYDVLADPLEERELLRGPLTAEQARAYERLARALADHH